MKLFILYFFILFCNTSFAKTTDFTTTRLVGTSGAGIGAILYHEATLLNPASIAFYNTSAFYYQLDSIKMNEPSDLRSPVYDDGPSETFIISDTSSDINGTFSYIHAKYDNTRTKRYASSFSKALDSTSAVGLIISYLDVKVVDSSDEIVTGFQSSLGYTNIISSKLTMGIVYSDFAQLRKVDERLIAGAQLQISENLFLLLDVGFNPNFDYQKTDLYRAGIQVNFTSSFLVRLGKSSDKNSQLISDSFGVSWVGPKLSLEFASKSSSALETNLSPLFDKEKILEQSLSVSVRF